MKKKIGRKIYNTDKSKLIGENVQGVFGDPKGFKETMYMKAEEDYFLLVSGGPETPYKAEEDIIPLSLEDAEEWIQRNCSDVNY